MCSPFYLFSSTLQDISKIKKSDPRRKSDNYYIDRTMYLISQITNQPEDNTYD